MRSTVTLRSNSSMSVASSGCWDSSVINETPPGCMMICARPGRTLAMPGSGHGPLVGGCGPSPRRAQPGSDVLLPGTQPAGRVQRSALGVVRLPVQIRAAGQEILRGAALACGAGVPERLRYLLCRRVAAQDRIEPGQQAQGGSMPGLVNSGAAIDQEPGNMPAGVADGVVERRADRAFWHFEIRAGIDQRLGHLEVIAARRVMQRCLRTRARLR